MLRSRIGCHTVLALLAGLVLAAGPAIAAPGYIPTERHPARANVATRPGGVPAGYVLTHNGWFDPSCVVNVDPDEVVGPDLVIRGAGGQERFRLAPCQHARFKPSGAAMAPSTSGSGVGTQASPPLEAASTTYDGYIVYYTFNGKLATGPTLTTEWVVPPAPANVATQDIAFFNDILTSAGGGDILQPVLDFNGEILGKWAIESEHCCIAGNDMQTTPIAVAPGDVIRGIVSGAGCDSTGVCQSWSVQTIDVTTGKTTTLNTTAPMGVANGVSPGSLETYGVTSCDMFPGGGETVFVNNTLVDQSGAAQSLKYNFVTLNGTNAEVPRNCGYGGMASGNEFTLIYGTVAATGDGGRPDGAGASHDGSTSAQDGSAGGGAKDAADTSAGSPDAARDATAADRGSPTGSGGSGTSSGTAGAGGSSDAGSADRGGPTAGAHGPSGSGGCSCDVVAGDGTPVLSCLLFALWLAGAARRRRD